MRRHIPNLLTLSNLVTGCCGIIHLFTYGVEYVYLFVWLSAFFDFLDGLVARWLGVSSSIGKDLDSLADVVSFGVLPALVMFKLIDGAGGGWLAYTALAIAAMSALRLALFNNDERQTSVFYGLPTPANALLLTALPLYQSHGYLSQIVQNAYILVGLTLLSSWLLVSEIKLISLKFQGRKWNGNQSRFVFLIFSILLIAWFRELAIPMVVLWYVIFSTITNQIRWNHTP